MSSRPLLKPQAVASQQSANGTSVSAVTNINMISLVSYNVSYTSGVTGNFVVQGCNDYVNPVGVQYPTLNTGSWVTIPITTPVLATGSAGTALIEISQTSAAYVRLLFTDTSGGSNTGSWTATIAGKVA